MVQPKHSPQEALERMKLMMKYDSSKTLTENVEVIKEEKQQINEFVPVVVGAAALWAWWNYGNKFNDPAQKVKAAFSACSTLKDVPPSTDVDFTGAADKIYDAIEGLGTDEDAVKEAFKMMKTPADICKLVEIYRNKYRDLYEDLDGDFSGSDWNKYVWSPIYDIMSKIPTPPPQPTVTGTAVPTVTPVPKTSKYHSCPDTFPIAQFCKNDTIRKVQGCLGIKADGAFGPGTQAALEAKGLPGTQITQDSVDKACGGTSTSQADENPEQQTISGDDNNF
jgi:hypothetical protein